MSNRYKQAYGRIIDTGQGEKGEVIASVEAVKCSRKMRDKIAKYAIEKLNCEERAKNFTPRTAV